jgi:hypothetical protein
MYDLRFSRRNIPEDTILHVFILFCTDFKGAPTPNALLTHLYISWDLLLPIFPVFASAPILGLISSDKIHYTKYASET